MKQERVVIIDYGGFSLPPAKEVEPERTAGKFVQIRNKGTEYLVLASRELAPYHADLVERFCEERGIAGTYVAERKRYDIHDPDWLVVGGGKFETDTRNKLIILFDNSMAYGRFDAAGLKKAIHGIKELADYTVKIM